MTVLLPLRPSASFRFLLRRPTTSPAGHNQPRLDPDYGEVSGLRQNLHDTPRDRPGLVGWEGEGRAGQGRKVMRGNNENVGVEQVEQAPSPYRAFAGRSILPTCAGLTPRILAALVVDSARESTMRRVKLSRPCPTRCRRTIWGHLREGAKSYVKRVPVGSEAGRNPDSGKDLFALRADIPVERHGLDAEFAAQLGTEVSRWAMEAWASRTWAFR